MLLALDIGNTQTTIGIYKDKICVKNARISSSTEKTSYDYSNEFINLLNNFNIAKEEIKAAVIGSVVPGITHEIKISIKNLFNFNPIVINYKSKSNLKFKINDPKTIGADLICGCAKAAEIYKLPCIVFDFGSATTACVIDENKNFLGGLIIPGIKISLDALTNKCALISPVDIESPQEIIGKDSPSCIQSGIIYSNASIVDGISNKIENSLNKECSVVLTGGFSKYIAPFCSKRVETNKNLVLDGLQLLYQYNKSK